MLPLILLATADDWNKVATPVPVSSSDMAAMPTAAEIAYWLNVFGAVPDHARHFRFHCLIDPYYGTNDLGCVLLDDRPPAATRDAFSVRESEQNVTAQDDPVFKAAARIVGRFRMKSTLSILPRKAAETPLRSVVITLDLGPGDRLAPFQPSDDAPLDARDFELANAPDEQFSDILGDALAKRDNDAFRVIERCRALADLSLWCGPATIEPIRGVFPPERLQALAKPAPRLFAGLRLNPSTRSGAPVAGRDVVMRVVYRNP